MASPSPQEKQLARLVEAGQFPEALEFARAHSPCATSSFSYLILACRAALGFGEPGYVTLWTKSWLDHHPNHVGGLRLFYSSLIEQGDIQQALQCLKKLVKAEPEAPERLELINHLAANQATTEAVEYIASAPELTIDLAILGHELSLGTKSTDAAIEWLEKAEALAPLDHRVILARYRLSPTSAHATNALEKLHAHSRATTDFQTVSSALRILVAHRELDSTLWLESLARIEPELDPKPYFELGLLWESFGYDEKALPLLESALSEEPNNSLAALSLSRLYLRNKRGEDALRVLTPFPREQLFSSPQLVKQLAEVAIYLTKYEIALAAQQVVVKHLPNDASEKIRLAQLCNFNGLYEDEIKLYDDCISVPETRLSSTILKTFSTPRIYTSEEQIVAVRQRILQSLESFETISSEFLQTQPQQLYKALSDHTNFSIGYQQYNDLSIQKSFGKVLHSINSKIHGEAQLSGPKASKPQVAFYTHFAWNHTVGKLFHRWMTGLSELGFDVAVVTTSQADDHITNRIKSAVQTFQTVDSHVSSSIQALRELTPDVIIFPELGMDPLAMGTAATRNAPIQCMAWGHPITSGLPTMDYFLSSDLMEPTNGQEHYSERLIRLPGLSIEYEAPELPRQPHTRSQLGLPSERVLLLSCQTLYKLLPRYDLAYIEVLKAVPDADLVFLGNRSRYITEQFKSRLEDVMIQHGIDKSRLHIIGPLPHDAYLSLNLVADVFLDAHGWSGGNTTLEALRANLPIVTTPGEFMRGRHSAAILEQIGLKHFVGSSVDEWTRQAIDYAKDERLRAAHALEIKESSHLAYRDSRVVEGLAQQLTKLYQSPKP